MIAPKKGSETEMKQIRIGDVTIDAVVEREGPWRRPQDFFPAYDEATFKRHLQVTITGSSGSSSSERLKGAEVTKLASAPRAISAASFASPLRLVRSPVSVVCRSRRH